MVYGLPNIQRAEQVCEAFIIGKQYKEEFEEVAWQEKQSLKLVNSDLCGHSYSYYVPWMLQVFTNFY